MNPRNSGQGLSNIYNYKTADEEGKVGARKYSRNIEERIQLSKSRLEVLNNRLHDEAKEKEARQSLLRLKHWSKDVQDRPQISEISREIVRTKFHR